MKLTIVSHNAQEVMKLLPALRELGIEKVVIKEIQPRRVQVPVLNLQKELAILDARQAQAK